MILSMCVQEKDIAHFEKFLRENSGMDVVLEHLEEQQLVALQVDN